jgi:periplasmic copper chaperone A
MHTTGMTFRRLTGAALALLCLALPAAADGLEVHDAYARTAYPGAPVAAAFMVIHNHGGPDDHLIDARSPIAARVELHTHIDAGDGVMQMRHVPEGFPLPTDGEILMTRGGHHVMFMGVTESLEPGDIVPLTLVFESGAELVLEVEVKADSDGSMDHGSMDHGTMDHGTMDHGDTAPETTAP